MQVYQGSYTQFKAYKLKKQEEQAAAEKISQAPETEKPSPKATQPKTGKTLSKYERKKLQSRLAEIETDLQSLEAQQAAVSARLETPPDDPDEVLRLGEEYMGLQQKMEERMAEWGQIEERLSAE